MKAIRFIGVEQTGGCGMERRHQVIEIIALLKNSSGSSINRPKQFLSVSLFSLPFFYC
jgi:hypothetical protein